jgi:hypothetical protein
MQLSKTLLAAAALVLSAQARIENIYVPATIAPTKGFKVILENTNWIINNEQFAVAVGEQPVGGPTDSLGTLLGSFYLGPDFSNQIGNVTRSVGPHTPTVPSGPVTLVFQVFSAYGASWFPVIEPFAVNVTYGKSNSKNLVVAHRV